MSTHRYALAPGGAFVHILPGVWLIALCGDTGQRSYRRRKKRSYWFVLAAKCPGPIPMGRKICVKCEEMMRGRK